MKTFGTIIKNKGKLYYLENSSGLYFLFPNAIKEEWQIEDLIKKSLQENKDYIYELVKDNQVKLNTEELKTYEDIQNDIYYQFEKKFGWIACMEPTSKLFYERNRIKWHFGFQKI